MHGFDGLGVLDALLLHFNLLSSLWNLYLRLCRVQTGSSKHEGRHLVILSNQSILILHDHWGGRNLRDGLDSIFLLAGRYYAVLILPLLARRYGIIDF